MDIISDFLYNLLHNQNEKTLEEIEIETKLFLIKQNFPINRDIRGFFYF